MVSPHSIRPTAARPAAGTRRSTIFPAQHGAWAFLLLPVVLGTIAAGWSWTAVPAVLAWVALYPFSWALTNRLCARRPERFNRALQIWALTAVPLLIGAVVLHPWLLWVGSVYAVPFAANVVFASARRERSLANDAVLIVECAAATPVVAGLSAGPGLRSVPWDSVLTTDVVLMTAVCALALTGSTLHVRSLIRERGNPWFAAVSRAFAVTCVPVVLAAGVQAGTGWWLVLPFVALAGRSLLLHETSWKPSKIGMVELAGLLLLAVCAAVALN